ncbi:hypothetical protein [Crucivirus-409]|nr:hypothetical protein [Crucivirus-409]QMW68879.1 hypothetical protein [Crucivirus-410]
MSQSAIDHIVTLENLIGHSQLHLDLLMDLGCIEDECAPPGHPFSVAGITRTLCGIIEEFQFVYGMSCWLNLNDHPLEDNGYPIYVIELFQKIRECMDLLDSYRIERIDHIHKNYPRE